MRLALLATIMAGGMVAALLAAPARPSADRSPRDRHGDRLPPGAVARLGSVRYRGPLLPCPTPGTLAVLRDNSAVVIDADTGVEIHRLPGVDPADFEVASMLVDPAGRRVAYGGDDRLLVLDAATGRVILNAHAGPAPAAPDQRSGVRPVAFVGTDHLVVELDASTTRAAVWDLTRSERLWCVDIGDAHGDEQSRVLGVVGQPPQIVALAQKQHETAARALDVRSGEWAGRVELGPGLQVHVAALSPDGKQIALADESGSGIHRFALPSGEALPGVDLPFEPNLIAMTYSPDGQRLAAMGFMGTNIFDAASGRRLARSSAFQVYTGDDFHLRFSVDGRTLWVWSSDYAAWRRFDGATARERALPDLGPRSRVNVLSVSPDGTRALVSSPFEEARVYDIRTMSVVRRLTSSPFSRLAGADDHGMESAQFSPDGSLIAARMADQRVVLWDAATGRIRRTLALRDDSGGEAIALSPDGQTLAVGPGHGAGQPNQQDHTLRLYSVATGKEWAKIGVGAGPAGWLGYSPEGRWLALTSHDGNQTNGLVVVDVHAGRVSRAVAGVVYAARFLPFGEALVYATPDELVVWDIQAGAARMRMAVPADDMIDLLAVSPCGRWLAGANNFSGTRKVYLWDLRLGEPLPPLVGHNGYITALAFGPGGRLFSGSQDTTVLVWDVSGRAGSAPRPITTDREWNAIWSDLAGPADAAHVAVERLIATGEPAVEFLKARLAPASASQPTQLVALIAKFDARSYVDRQTAARAIERFDRQAEHALRLAAESPSAEVRNRAGRMLGQLQSPSADVDRLRELRCVEFLARHASPPARDLLKRLASGEASARLTLAARQALAHAERRRPEKH
jgi:WD40 repeat protein